MSTYEHPSDKSSEDLFESFDSTRLLDSSTIVEVVASRVDLISEPCESSISILDSLIVDDNDLACSDLSQNVIVEDWEERLDFAVKYVPFPPLHLLAPRIIFVPPVTHSKLAISRENDESVLSDMPACSKSHVTAAGMSF